MGEPLHIGRLLGAEVNIEIGGAGEGNDVVVYTVRSCAGVESLQLAIFSSKCSH